MPGVFGFVVQGCTTASLKINRKMCVSLHIKKISPGLWYIRSTKDRRQLLVAIINSSRVQKIWKNHCMTCTHHVVKSTLHHPHSGTELVEAGLPVWCTLPSSSGRTGAMNLPMFRSARAEAMVAHAWKVWPHMVLDSRNWHGAFLLWCYGMAVAVQRRGNIGWSPGSYNGWTPIFCYHISRWAPTGATKATVQSRLDNAAHLASGSTLPKHQAPGPALPETHEQCLFYLTSNIRQDINYTLILEQHISCPLMLARI